MTGDDCRPENCVGASLDVNLNEPLFIAVGDGPVHIFKGPNERLDRDTPLAGLLFVQPHAGNLRVSVGAPGNGQPTQSLSPEKQ